VIAGTHECAPILVVYAPLAACRTVPEKEPAHSGARARKETAGMALTDGRPPRPSISIYGNKVQQVSV